MIDLKTLKQLIKLMTDHDLSELDLQDGEEKVKLKRGGADSNVQLVAPPTAPLPAAPPPAAAAGGGDSPEATPTKEDGLETITSPMVGTFYASPSPDAAAFVNVGDAVSAESVVCVIEAMKVFNEIKAEAKGTIVEVLVENGQAVDFGQPLFLVKP